MLLVLWIHNFGSRIELLKPKKRKKKPEQLTKDDEKVEEFFIQENSDEIPNEFKTSFEENNFEDMDVEQTVEE